MNSLSVSVTCKEKKHRVISYNLHEMGFIPFLWNSDFERAMLNVQHKIFACKVLAANPCKLVAQQQNENASNDDITLKM
jgi:hypothetical protein